MRKLALLLVLVTVGALGFYGGWLLGSEKGQAKGYSAGYKKGEADNPPVDLSLFVLTSEHEALRKDYSDLIEDYNSLVNYANTPRYQPRQPLHCTSYDFGISSTSTTCY